MVCGPKQQDQRILTKKMNWIVYKKCLVKVNIVSPIFNPFFQTFKMIFKKKKMDLGPVNNFNNKIVLPGGRGASP